MKLQVLLFSTFIFLSGQTYAALNLAPPDTLLKRAAESRQELLDVVLSIELQLPEMRDVKTFESYFFILDQLQIEADTHGLDDLYPDAVKSVGKKMAAFGVKWLDLSVIQQERLSYYLKWMDIEALSNLLSYTSYHSKKITDPKLLRSLSTNVEFVIDNTKNLTQDRFDVEVGFRELSSAIAIKFLLKPGLSDEDTEFWAQKIYTSQGLSLYADQVQRLIYALKKDSAKNIHAILKSIEICFQISKRLIDSPTSYNYERISDLFVETIKKSFELAIVLPPSEIESHLRDISPRHLQGLSYFITTAPEIIIFRNAQGLMSLGPAVLDALIEKNLMTEAYSLNQFFGKTAASVRMFSLNAEGTYRLIDKKGKAWKISLIRTKPFEVIAALANEDWTAFVSYYSVRYSVKDETFIAAETNSEGGTIFSVDSLSATAESAGRSIMTFKIDQNLNIEFNSVYGPDHLQNLKGQIVEKISPLVFTPKAPTSFTVSYEGQIQFASQKKPTPVVLTIQSDGITSAARLKDEYGFIYDFTAGFFSGSQDFTLTTAKLKDTTWTQLRGSMSDEKISGRLIVGGKGIITKDFILKRKR